jgi:hypothetical protein
MAQHSNVPYYFRRSVSHIITVMVWIKGVAYSTLRPGIHWCDWDFYAFYSSSEKKITGITLHMQPKALLRKPTHTHVITHCSNIYMFNTTVRLVTC